MIRDAQEGLEQLFRCSFEIEPIRVVYLGADGSKRRYYRLSGGELSAVGTINNDRRENVAFLALSRHFRRYGLPVPEIYAEDLGKGIYLQQDLGDDTLYDQLLAIRGKTGTFSDRLIKMYKQVLDDLPQFQVAAATDLDYSICYPRSCFDKQSIRWDLNYFKYHFLKLVPVDFDEQALEDDFDRITRFLLEAETSYFLYRDFQSRNIMWYDGRPHYIDYQGGRKGALQYDVASLLQDAKADIPWEIRDNLLDHYINAVGKYAQVRYESFLAYYYGYALVRIMQSLGAYGYRGLYEGKTHFLTSIFHGVRNLKGLIRRANLPIYLPELNKVWDSVIDSPTLRDMGESSSENLTIQLWSFSYHRGQPRDPSGNGGGFVFDCRILPNPGRHTEYEEMTGMDLPVANFLDGVDEVQSFLRDVKVMIDKAVDHHVRRGFKNLTVAFGCTGGQHRSVYFAEQLAEHLKDRKGLLVKLQHREQEGV